MGAIITLCSCVRHPLFLLKDFQNGVCTVLTGILFRGSVISPQLVDDFGTVHEEVDYFVSRLHVAGSLVHLDCSAEYRSFGVPQSVRRRGGSPAVLRRNTELIR